jgi:hypothetical protein
MKATKARIRCDGCGRMFLPSDSERRCQPGCGANHHRQVFRRADKAAESAMRVLEGTEECDLVTALDQLTLRVWERAAWGKPETIAALRSAADAIERDEQEQA